LIDQVITQIIMKVMQSGRTHTPGHVIVGVLVKFSGV